MAPINLSLEHTTYDPWSDDKRWTKRRSKCWKDKSKRRHQYRRTVSITIEPGFILLHEHGACIVPMYENFVYDKE